MAEVLDAAAAEVNAGALASQPAVEVQVHMTIADTYRTIGRVASARQHLEKALALAREVHGEPSAEVAAALVGLGLIRSIEGDLFAAGALNDRAVEIRRFEPATGLRRRAHAARTVIHASALPVCRNRR